MQKITLNEAMKRITATNNRIFSVIFTKKCGEKRHMVCRLGVRKHLTGKGQVYNPKDYGLLTVFDMSKNAYRNINLNQLHAIQIDGKQYHIVGNE